MKNRSNGSFSNSSAKLCHCGCDGHSTTLPAYTSASECSASEIMNSNGSTVAAQSTRMNTYPAARSPGNSRSATAFLRRTVRSRGIGAPPHAQLQHRQHEDDDQQQVRQCRRVSEVTGVE